MTGASAIRIAIPPPPPVTFMHAIVDSDARRAASTVSSLKKAWERMNNQAQGGSTSRGMRKRKLSSGEDCDEGQPEEQGDRKRRPPVFVTFRDVNDVLAISRGNNKFASILVATGSKDGANKLACLNELQGESVLIRVLVDNANANAAAPTSAPATATTVTMDTSSSVSEGSVLVDKSDVVGDESSSSWKTISYPITPPVASAALEAMSPSSSLESPEPTAHADCTISPPADKAHDRGSALDRFKSGASLCSAQEPLTGVKRMAKAMTRVRKSLREVAAVDAKPFDRHIPESAGASTLCLTDTSTSTSTSTEATMIEVSDAEGKSPKFAVLADDQLQSVSAAAVAVVPESVKKHVSASKAKQVSLSSESAGEGGKLWKDMLRPGHIAFRLEPGGRLDVLGMDEVATLNFEFDNNTSYVDAGLLFDAFPSARSTAIVNAVARAMRKGVRRVVCLNLYTAKSRVPLACQFDIVVIPRKHSSASQQPTSSATTSSSCATTSESACDLPITAVASIRSISAVSCADILGLDLEQLAQGVCDVQKLEARLTELLLQ